jgi:hypothetical protein
MSQENFQGLVIRSDIFRQSFIQSIANKQRVYIGNSIGLSLNVIRYCRQNPNLNLYISKNLYMPTVMAFAFKLDFDEKIIDEINKV